MECLLLGLRRIGPGPAENTVWIFGDDRSSAVKLWEGVLEVGEHIIYIMV